MRKLEITATSIPADPNESATIDRASIPVIFSRIFFDMLGEL